VQLMSLGSVGLAVRLIGFVGSEKLRDVGFPINEVLNTLELDAARRGAGLLTGEGPWPSVLTESKRVTRLLSGDDRVALPVRVPGRISLASEKLTWITNLNGVLVDICKAAPASQVADYTPLVRIVRCSLDRLTCQSTNQPVLSEEEVRFDHSALRGCFRRLLFWSRITSLGWRLGSVTVCWTTKR
jgi:hypothetical protein